MWFKIRCILIVLLLNRLWNNTVTISVIWCTVHSRKKFKRASCLCTYSTGHGRLRVWYQNNHLTLYNTREIPTLSRYGAWTSKITVKGNSPPPSFLSLSRFGGNEVVWTSFLLPSFCLSDLVGFLLLTLNRSLLFQLGEFSASCTWILKRLSLIFGSKQLGFIHVFVNRPFPVYSSEQRHQKLTLSLRKFSDLYRRVSRPPRVIMSAITGLVFGKRLFNQRTLHLFRYNVSALFLRI